jgi:transposase
MAGRRKYTREFKLDAVKLIVEEGRSVRDVARSLGVNETVLHTWKRGFLERGELAFPGNGHRQTGTDLEEEVRRLKKENAELKKDQEILKKAAAFFAKHQS